MEYKIIKNVDNLGRIVLPKEMRKCYGIDLNEGVEIIPTERGILIRKIKDAVGKGEAASSESEKK